MHYRKDPRFDAAEDHQRTLEMVEDAIAEGETALRVWEPPDQIVFGPRDLQREGFERAMAIARDAPGTDVRTRGAGGHAVAIRPGTLAFVLAGPIADPRTGIEDRYERVVEAVQRALAEYGAEVWPGEPDDAFCPGSHSLQNERGKVAGFAQRVRGDRALVTGVVVTQGGPMASTLDPIYDALGIPFDPESVGSIDTEDHRGHLPLRHRIQVSLNQDDATDADWFRGT